MLNCTRIRLGKAMETPLRWKDGESLVETVPSGSCEIGRREAMSMETELRSKMFLVFLNHRVPPHQY